MSWFLASCGWRAAKGRYQSSGGTGRLAAVRCLGLDLWDSKGHSKAEAPTGERKQQQLWEIWLKIKGKKKERKTIKIGLHYLQQLKVLC